MRGCKSSGRRVAKQVRAYSLRHPEPRNRNNYTFPCHGVLAVSKIDILRRGQCTNLTSPGNVMVGTKVCRSQGFGTLTTRKAKRSGIFVSHDFFGAFLGLLTVYSCSRTSPELLKGLQYLGCQAYFFLLRLYWNHDPLGLEIATT